MPKRLRELERERRDEQRKAERWLRNHPEVGDLPGRRLDTGESAARERQHVEHSTGTYSTTDTVAEWEAMNQQFTPLVGRAQDLSPEELERRLRIEHVFTFLLPDHQELLRQRHVERMTLEAIGAEWGVSHVAIIHRLQTAEQDFRKQYGLHYEDPGVADA